MSINSLFVVAADYLLNLRNNRPVRPAGSRPFPSKTATLPQPPRDSSALRSESALSFRPQDIEPLSSLPEKNGPPRCASALSYHQSSGTTAQSDLSIRSRKTTGEPLTGDPGQNPYSIRGRKVSPAAVVEPSARSVTGNYRESGAKWLERQEAISLREALQEMDHRTDEERIHAAAQDEAAELVWQHRNPSAAEREKSSVYANPDIHREGRHRFTAHLKKGAYSRSQHSIHKAVGALPPSGALVPSSDSSHSFSKANNIDPPTITEHPASERKVQREQSQAGPHPNTMAVRRNEPSMKFIRRKSSGQRKISNSSRQDGFPNADGQIYEDSGNLLPQEKNTTTSVSTTATPLRLTNRNSQLRGSRPLPGRPNGSAEEKKKTIDRFEIQRNPPSQSRSAGYTRNTIPASIDVIPELQTSPSKDGLEIRGEDIRAATSMKRKDRSSNLPLPTAVSDRPGRPIVSFDPDWKCDNMSREESLETERPGPKPFSTVPAVTVSSPTIPTINVSGMEATPGATTIMSEDKTIPAINVQSDDPSSGTITAQPCISRPSPQPSKSMPAALPMAKTSSPRLPWLSPSSAAGVPTARCANCALPISGRIVTASGSGPSSSSLKARFHPECFTCHHCSTALECVAFYPEPEDKRLKRLEASGSLRDPHDESKVVPESELRFYCHLDFHELFSPRCRSCKTPIEGEVIVAAGAEWHVGHFFCSECGDPFDSHTPFVEKDNYAYCVSCHTRRTSARCRSCKKPILDETTVQALGGQWHADCFNCFECGGGFGPEGRFFVRDVRVEGTEKEKRRGIATKMEERAVCEACEGRRLKA